MHITSRVSVLLLAAVAQALPGPMMNVIDVSKSPAEAGLQSRAVAAASIFIQGDDENKCGGTSFESKSTSYSATASDCQCIADNLARPDWRGKFYVRPVDGSKFGTTAVTCQSCMFVIKSNNDFGTNVGGQDIIDIVREAVSRYSRDSKIGATGNMNCENDNGRGGSEGQSATTWTLAHVPN